MTFGATILAEDARLSAEVRASAARVPWLRPIAIPFARSGDAWLWYLIAGAVAVAGDHEVRGTTLFVVIAIVATGLVVRVAKAVTHRARPDGEWGGSYRRQDPHAFPSGHAARAALLTVLAFALGPPWLGMLMTVWLLLVAYSRVALGVHYVSDVVAGTVLGLGCGLIAASVLTLIPSGR